MDHLYGGPSVRPIESYNFKCGESQWITPLPGNHACAVGPIKADLGHDEFPLHRLRSCTFIGFIRVVPKSRCLETMHFTIAIGTEADLGNDDFCYIVLRNCTFMDLSESKPRFHLFYFLS
jgi:hypothetical protein